MSAILAGLRDGFDGPLAQYHGITFALLRESDDCFGQGHSNRIVPIYAQLAYSALEGVNEELDLVWAERAHFL